METIIAIDEFLTLVEPHAVPFLIVLMAFFGGIFAFLDAASDFGFWAYRLVKRGVLALWNKAKCYLSLRRAEKVK